MPRGHVLNLLGPLTDVAIAEQLAKWSAGTDEPFGGKLWGYRHGRPIRPSDVRNWAKYLESVRSSDLKVVVPKLVLRWVVQALPDPVDSSRLTVHAALENWTEPLNKSNNKELEPSLQPADLSSAAETFPQEAQ